MSAIRHRSHRPLAMVEIWLWHHGWWMPMALVLLLAAAALWMWQLRPVSRQIELEDAAFRVPAAAPTQPPPNTRALSDSQRVLAFRGVLQPLNQSTEVMRHVVAATLQEFQWSQAEFQQTREQGLDVVRLQVTVPVLGAYPPMRKALERVLRENPGLSLDAVTFRRAQANQVQLEARLKMSLWLAPMAKGESNDAMTREGLR